MPSSDLSREVPRRLSRMDRLPPVSSPLHVPAIFNGSGCNRMEWVFPRSISSSWLRLSVRIPFS